jgi:hypothetical protein
MAKQSTNVAPSPKPVASNEKSREEEDSLLDMEIDEILRESLGGVGLGAKKAPESPESGENVAMPPRQDTFAKEPLKLPVEPPVSSKSINSDDIREMISGNAEEAHPKEDDNTLKSGQVIKLR